MRFSITSALLGGLIILIYSFWIDVITSYRSNNSSHYDAKFAVAIIILILGICFACCWNLGSNKCLFDESLQLLCTDVGKYP